MNTNLLFEFFLIVYKVIHPKTPKPRRAPFIIVFLKLLIN